MGRLVMIGGGVRCGKSAFALERARQLGDALLFVATAEAGDDEMAARIRAHQAERGDVFTTVEAPLDVVETLSTHQEQPAVLDCLTLWLSNMLLASLDDAAIEQAVSDLLQAQRERPAELIVVSNEVGMGLVPETAIGRRFRDLTGRAHQRLAAAADEVYFGAMGLLLQLKPPPIQAVER